MSEISRSGSRSGKAFTVKRNKQTHTHAGNTHTHTHAHTHTLTKLQEFILNLN